MYDFSVKNCTLINPKLIKDELIIDTNCSICLDKLINLPAGDRFACHSH